MFYAQLILAKKGALGKVWMAAHWDKKLNRQLIFTTDVTKSAESIANPGSAMPLRVSGSLLLGIVRIFSHKVKYLNTDCDLALSKMKMAFRPNMEPAEEADDDSGGEERGEDGGGDNGANRGNKSSKKARLGPPLTFDMLPDVDDEWLQSAALTMARKQDITMEEGEKLSRAHADGGGFGALELAGRDVEQWEAFDPSALCDDEEEVGGEEVVAAVRGAVTQGRKGWRGEEEEEEEEDDRVNGVEEHQRSRVGEDPEDDRAEKGDDDTASAFNGACDGSFDAGGTGDHYGDSGDEHEGEITGSQDMIETAMEEGEDSAMEVEQGRFSHADAGMKAREPSLDLDGAVEHKGEEVEDQEVMDRASELEKTALDTEAVVMEEEAVGSLHEEGHGEAHGNGVLDDRMDSPMPGAAVGGLGFMSEERRVRRSDDAPKRGKKRPLPLDRTLVIPGPIMREYLADYSDLVVKRRRPVERAVAAAKAKLTGGPLPPVEVRMATHTFSGQISPDLEWLFQMLMKPVHEVDIPVPKRPQYVARQPIAKRSEQHESPQRNSEKCSGDVNGVEETKQNDPRYPPVEADAVKEEDEGYGGGGGGGAEVFGNQYDNDDDTYHRADEVDDGINDDVGGGEAPRSGGEDNRQDDDAEFVRQNEAAQQTDATQANNCWHPNTIRMCKLLRARMALSSSSSARDVKGVSFRGLCHKRSKAAMKFFEVLQLKTWDFIEVEQTDPFGDIHVLPARRFHEPIPE